MKTKEKTKKHNNNITKAKTTPISASNNSNNRKHMKRQEREQMEAKAAKKQKLFILLLLHMDGHREDMDKTKK